MIFSKKPNFEDKETLDNIAGMITRGKSIFTTAELSVDRNDKEIATIVTKLQNPTQLSSEDAYSYI